MTLSKLKKSEQVLLATVITVLVLGIYSFFRFIPENDSIGLTQRQAANIESKLQSARIPHEPEQNVEQLLIALDDQEQALALTQDMAENIEQRLAVFGSQQLKVRISELARTSGVRIRTNEAFQPIIKGIINKVKSRVSKASRAKARAEALAILAETDVILPSNYSWMERMSAKTIFHRPMQRIVLNGDFQSIRRFIHGLEDLQWQVTVVRLSIDKMPTAPLGGYAQQLSSELVLAL